MTDWTEGYVADIGYTYGYYTELNPIRAKMALNYAGLVAPDTATACELGFGQGVSTNIHAAASTTQWWGTDFNPSQASFAQALAESSGAAAKLYDDAFAEFCHRPDLPDFDFIGLHGIWSWISDENRAVLVDFIRRKLKVGGAVYVSYNTQPGWAAFVPFRSLLTEHSERLGAPGQGIAPRIDAAIAFADKLMAAKPQYAAANPQVAERLAKLKAHGRNYLAHEYFNRDWHPMPFAKMAEWLAPSKLSFACSANYFDHIDGLNLTAEQQVLLKEIPDPMFRQTVRDFCVNQQFRKDYWVKGPRNLRVFDQAQLLREQRVVLVQPRAGVTLKIVGALGEATLQQPIYDPILDALAGHQSKSIEQLEGALAGKGLLIGQLLQALMVLIGHGAVALVQEDAVIAKAKKNTAKLNSEILRKSRNNSEVEFLASPVLGAGVSVPRFHQLFLLAREQGKKLPREWAQFAATILEVQKERIIKDGKQLQNEAENLAELEIQADKFSELLLPIHRAVGIA
jgi:hypothetical protein